MARVRAHHGMGLVLGQDDFSSYDFTDFTDPAPIAPSIDPGPLNIVSSAPIFSPAPVMPVLAPSSPSSIMLPSSLQTATFADGSKGFFDPADGTYYDSQGNDISGYVQNFGGAKITGTASASQIAAAEGIATPGAAPRVSTSPVPPAGALQAFTAALFGPAATMPKPAAAGAAPSNVATIAGMSMSSLLMLGLGAAALLLVAGRK